MIEESCLLYFNRFDETFDILTFLVGKRSGFALFHDPQKAFVGTGSEATEGNFPKFTFPSSRVSHREVLTRTCTHTHTQRHLQAHVHTHTHTHTGRYTDRDTHTDTLTYRVVHTQMQIHTNRETHTNEHTNKKVYTQEANTHRE